MTGLWRRSPYEELSVRDYVEGVLQRALEDEERTASADERQAWSRLSSRAFARDWDSEEDQAHDRLV